jgi:hypothetical protein
MEESVPSVDRSCCKPGDITVAPINGGFLIGRIVSGNNGEENGPSWEYLQVIDALPDALEVARHKARTAQSNAWFQEEDTPCRSLLKARAETHSRGAEPSRPLAADRRTATRIPAGRISVWAPGYRAPLTLRDMSRDGFGVVSPKSCEVGAVQEFSFLLPGAVQTLTFRATAVHCTPSPEGFIIGWVFPDPGDSDLR